MRKYSIAILFFSRTFEDEFKAKTLDSQKEEFKSYYYYQVNRTLSIAHQSGLAFHLNIIPMNKKVILLVRD